MLSRKWIGLVVYLVLVLGSCSRETAILPGSTQFDVAVSNATFQPALWRVPAGEKIVFRMDNLDPTQHDFTILLRPTTLPFSTIDPADIYYQKQLEPNSSTVMEFHAPPAPGEYQVLSTLPGNAEKGMIGTLVVVQLSTEE
ncbi:MAG: hypothetical protein HPY59_15440 [Anaerolineae bacterium]|nr:hypothetical protein [Anaerolineae bacterium]